MIERDRCAVTGAADLEPLHRFEEFPVFMGCTTQPPKEDLRAPMDWWISRSSGLIQLRYLLPLDILYADSHGSGCVGALWEKHHRAFADFLKEANPAGVFEIGGGHGILAAEYARLKKVSWTILEPNPSPVAGCPAEFIAGFFDETFSFSGKFDTVVHSHVFEHMYEPASFMAHLSGFMEEGKHLVFSLPNMRVMLERKYTNCINFEHTAFLTEPYVEYLLAKHGFRIVRKKYFMDDHSIFYAAVRDRKQEQVGLPAGLHAEHRVLYETYVQYHKDLIGDLNTRMDKTAGPVYLFGAHVFAQYLLAFGLHEKRITNLLDNDSNKQGKRLYGTNLNAESPKVLAGIENPSVILKAGVYNDEIKADIRSGINSSTVFFE